MLGAPGLAAFARPGKRMTVASRGWLPWILMHEFDLSVPAA
jgi:hypothetical protein